MPQPDWKRIPTCRRQAFGNLYTFESGIRVPSFPRRWAGISRISRTSFPGQLRNRIVAGHPALRILRLELWAQPKPDRRSKAGSKYPEKCEKSSRVIPVFPNPLQDSAGGKREQPMPLRTPAVGWGLAWRMKSAATYTRENCCNATPAPTRGNLRLRKLAEIEEMWR